MATQKASIKSKRTAASKSIKKAAPGKAAKKAAAKGGKVPAKVTATSKRAPRKEAASKKGAAKRVPSLGKRGSKPAKKKAAPQTAAKGLAVHGTRKRPHAAEPTARPIMVKPVVPPTVSAPRVRLPSPVAGPSRAPAAVETVPVARQSVRPVMMSAELERKIGSDERLSETVRAMSEQVTFQVSPTTLSKLVLKHVRGRLREHAMEGLRLDPGATERAIDVLGRHGIEVIRRGRFGLTCRGSTSLLSDLLKTPFRIVSSMRPSSVRSLGGSLEAPESPQPEELSIVPEHSLSMAPDLSPAIDHFTFYPAPLFFHALPIPVAAGPVPAWHHLTGADLRRLLQVPQGDGAPTGRGIRVAMIDTGFHPHPYFAPFDYQAVNIQGNRPSSVDRNGHGTAMAWNVFQVAPEATLLGLGHTPVPSDALEVAAESDAQIISCSWGYDREEIFPALELTVRDLVAEGRTVLFASGNGHYAWPGSMPEVLSVGGVYADEMDALEASGFASGFQSSAYPGRQVPDVCGLVGQPPRAIYLMMPCPPGCEMDRQLGGQPYPDRDGTRTTDGWVGASGTSAATPQLAGIVALILERAAAIGRVLSPTDVKAILQQSGQPVSNGYNAQGLPATPQQPNVAVGYGLANAGAALALV